MEQIAVNVHGDTVVVFTREEATEMFDYLVQHGVNIIEQ